MRTLPKNVIGTDSAWLLDLADLEPVEAFQHLAQIGAIGPRPAAGPFISDLPGSPWSFALEFAARCQLAEQSAVADATIETRPLTSLPFYSLCRGLYLPLIGWDAAREQSVFGTKTPPASDREALLGQFLNSSNGLTLAEKVGFFLADPFDGRVPPLSEESVIQMLSQAGGLSLSETRQRLVRLGSPPMLAASFKSLERSTPPLSSREVFLALNGLRQLKMNRRRELFSELLGRCGRLEAYCLVGLMLGKLHLNWGQRQGALQAALAARWGIAKESFEAAVGLRDIFSLTRLVEQEGVAALEKVVLQPLVAFRPCLAQTLDGDLSKVKLPAWAECKYDGIRLLVHKLTGADGRIQGAAYTRRRNDWYEMIPGLSLVLQSLPVQSCIVDGELHGTILTMEGTVRPATVYEVHQRLRGEGSAQLKFVAFDLLYLQGQDLTKLPLWQRRQQLERLITPLSAVPLPLPLQLSSGTQVENHEQLQRCYQQFRAQGHEGLMLKDIQAPYLIDQRSPYWRKKKPEISLELVLTGAFWGEQAGKTPGRFFDSYVVSCRRNDNSGGWQELGTVAGVDTAQTQSLVYEIQRQQLLTGQTIQYRGNDRVATGVALTPYLVVSVAFEGVVRDSASGEISLRGPRIRAIRSGELTLSEVARYEDLEKLALKDRLG